MPIIEQLCQTFPQAIWSIDTIHAQVAREAVNRGVHIINDISGGQLDDNLLQTVAELGVPYILMHMLGTPSTMTQKNQYTHLLDEMLDYFVQKITHLHQLGIHEIIIDPGFGFSKNIKQNFSLLKQLNAFRIFEQPLLVGLSRKSMIWRTLDISSKEALNGTTALHMMALQQGANLLRVHDVKEAKQAILLYDRITSNDL